MTHPSASPRPPEFPPSPAEQTHTMPATGQFQEGNFPWFVQGGDGAESGATQPVNPANAYPDEVDYYGMGLQLKGTTVVDQGAMRGELPRGELRRLENERRRALAETSTTLTPEEIAAYGRHTLNLVTQYGPDQRSEVPPEVAARYRREFSTEDGLRPILLTHGDDGDIGRRMYPAFGQYDASQGPADASYRHRA